MMLQFGTIFGSKTGVPPYTDDPNREHHSEERRSEERCGERQEIRFFDIKSPLGRPGILVNGSDGGAFIETNDTLPLLTVIRIEAPDLVCHAQICRVHWLRPDERDQRSSGMAVKLLASRPAVANDGYLEADPVLVSFTAAFSNS